MPKGGNNAVVDGNPLEELNHMREHIDIKKPP